MISMLMNWCSNIINGTAPKPTLRSYLDFDMLEKKLDDPYVMPMSLPLDFLKSITCDFSKERQLGSGGFGVVYKGILQNGKTIAVKKLYDVHLDDDQFFNEVTYLIGTKHKNIVQILGYCGESKMEAIQVNGKYVMAEIRHRLICFEYINNKTLDEYISDESSGLEWYKRFAIIRKICYGLHYLHKECNIVHLDLKPRNILMDDNMVPKIADFGTASKLFDQQKSLTITKSLKGTLGYMAPEYLNNRSISYKSDIFSLGVIIIELLTGSKNYPQNSSDEASSGNFIENVLGKWRNRLATTSRNIALEICIKQINTCTVIGLRCVDVDPEKRPNTQDLIRMLDESESDDIRMHRTSCGYISSSYDYGSEVTIITHKRPVMPYKTASLRASVPVMPYKTANVRDLYRIGKELGQGHSDTTYRCVRKADGAEYACRSIPKRNLWLEKYDNLHSEIQIMHHLSDNPDVVRIHGVYKDGLFVHIVMELCAGGNLLDRIVSKPQGHYSERDAAQLVRKIIRAVDGCHSLGVVHRNIKPENLLFDSNDEDAAIKLTGFEFSELYMPGDRLRYPMSRPSTYYVAPELHYGPEADIWSVGVILYILLSGVPTFRPETKEGISREISHGILDFESVPWPSISDSAKDLIRRILTLDPKKRLSAHEVLCHPWIIDDGVAPNKPTDSAVLSRLKHFSAMNMFTKMALKVIAESMSEDEIGGLKELFKWFDTDNSGTITFDELKDGLKRLGATLLENEIQVLMDAADMDSNGTIDCSEFVAATLHMNKLEREENLVAAFSFFDKDANGFITTNDLSEACSELGVDGVPLEDIIKQIDQDNDGRIGYDEFVAMMRKGNA